MEHPILISSLNDFLFCPYSIYLHNVYMDTDEDVYHAAPQTQGKAAHESIDRKTYSNRKNDILSMPVFCEELGIMGKIDLFKTEEKKLVERKYQLKKIYKGQTYQLWAQYFCLVEMGYEVNELAFYETSTNKMYPVALPTADDKVELSSLIDRFKAYSPENPIQTNPNKCSHCVYCNLCDKTETDNVYT